MADLFSASWARAYMEELNSDSEITDTLQKAGFSSVVAFGLPDENEPAFVMAIENGLVSSVNNTAMDDIKWDIRANTDVWLSLIVKPPGLMKLGIAYTSRKLRFEKGDYATMIKDPSLAAAFVKSFALMGRVLQLYSISTKKRLVQYQSFFMDDSLVCDTNGIFFGYCALSTTIEHNTMETLNMKAPNVETSKKWFG